MSDSSSDQRNQRSGGQRRSGGNRRRRNNNGGRNRNRSNRGGGQQGRRGGGGSRSGGRRQPPKPVPLTWWQKFLKALGLYDPNKAPKRTSPSRAQQAPENKADRNRADRKPKSGTRTAKSEPKPVETNRLYVGNLSYDATEYDLEDLFKGAGTVLSVEIVYNRNTHRSKGYGFIEMSSIDEAKRAVEILHDQSFMNRQMIVSGAKSKGPADTDDDQPAAATTESDDGSEEAA